MLALDIDPKLAWALRHREQFPVDLNRAPWELLVRVPGLGTKTVARLLKMRRWKKICLADLTALRARVTAALPFVVCGDYRPQHDTVDSARLRSQLAPQGGQLALDI
jgi:predicted DNA-binding helix-hairpin-helix protein